MSDDRLQALAVIVVNYGGTALLEQGLVRVARELAPARVVVVDNFSTSTVRSAVRELASAQGWIGVYPDSNTGFGTGSNLGAATALAGGAEHLLFLNPDATIDAKSVRRLLGVVTTDPACLAAPIIVNSRGEFSSGGIDLNLHTGDMRAWRRRTTGELGSTLPWVSGACLVVDAARWASVGGFDDEYFLYWEDVDLCARWLLNGGRIAVIADAVAVHDAGQTHTAEHARAKSSTYYYYNIRNRELFAARWLTPDERGRWRRRSLGAAYRILMRGGRLQFRHPVAPTRAALRGLRDGFRLARQTASASRGVGAGALAGVTSQAVFISSHPTSSDRATRR